ncbi:helix-turn-helix transcriptional regulator [Klebsiella pneumoniae]
MFDIAYVSLLNFLMTCEVIIMRGCNCEIKCIACGLNCRIEAKNKIERTLCGEKKFSVWPDRNYFFKRAVNDLVFRELTCFVPEGIVVVDFSLGNILYFLNECWTRKLRDSGLKIILIADKNMMPMANFWRLRSGFSWAVVEVNSDLSNLINKIKRVMLGRNLLCRRTPSLTEHEMKTLYLLAEGHSSQDIARIMACDTRSVYRFQYSLCKKFGGLNRLRNLRFRHTIPALD